MIRDAHDLAIARNWNFRDAYVTTFNTATPKFHLNIGDKVLLHAPNLASSAVNAKLNKPWVGPFSVKKVFENNNVLITRDDNTKQQFRVHLDRIKIFRGTVGKEYGIQPQRPEQETQVKRLPPKPILPGQRITRGIAQKHGIIVENEKLPSRPKEYVAKSHPSHVATMGHQPRGHQAQVPLFKGRHPLAQNKQPFFTDCRRPSDIPDPFCYSDRTNGKTYGPRQFPKRQQRTNGKRDPECILPFVQNNQDDGFPQNKTTTILGNHPRCSSSNRHGYIQYHQHGNNICQRKLSLTTRRSNATVPTTYGRNHRRTEPAHQTVGNTHHSTRQRDRGGEKTRPSAGQSLRSKGCSGQDGGTPKPRQQPATGNQATQIPFPPHTEQRSVRPTGEISKQSRRKRTTADFFHAGVHHANAYELHPGGQHNFNRSTYSSNPQVNFFQTRYVQGPGQPSQYQRYNMEIPEQELPGYGYTQNKHIRSDGRRQETMQNHPPQHHLQKTHNHKWRIVPITNS
ncbi:Hypothetical predicted protein [Paramuricea clavata]|uniref:Uncharacterized protein n=1 Tax=Paramuricea clavata TaxID=317549 RepID=A0A6S7KQG9_PARCT|nr:Hypothetical predicted protein [Paramuricea clavata]